MITNNVNGKYYYGVHSTDDLDDGYMGSGKALKRAQKKHGIEHFTKEILKFFDTEEDMYAYEREIVDMERVRDTNCYNLRIGGEGGNSWVGKTEKEMIEFRVKMSEINKGERNGFYGRHCSEEHKRQISEANKGKPGPNKGKKFSEEHKRNLSESHKGIPRTEEEKKKISDKLKGRPSPMKGKTGCWKDKIGPNKGKHWRLDPETNKRVYY